MLAGLMSGSSMARVHLELTVWVLRKAFSLLSWSCIRPRWTSLLCSLAKEYTHHMSTPFRCTLEELTCRVKYIDHFATQYALHCINHDKFSSSQTRDFNNAFMNAMGVQPLLECSYSKVSNLVYCEGSPLLYSSLSVVCIHPFNELFACMC